MQQLLAVGHPVQRRAAASQCKWHHQNADFQLRPGLLGSWSFEYCVHIAGPEEGTYRVIK